MQEVLKSLSDYPTEAPLGAPEYNKDHEQCRKGPRVMLAVPSMERHTSDEGWQLALALQAGGYRLCGPGGRVGKILEDLGPSVVVVQDQHEWDSGHLAKREEYFHNVEMLAECSNIFRVTVVKDTHRQYESAKRYSQLIGCHAWIVYYHPAVVLRTLSWLRSRHVIRTYHTVDAAAIPPYSAGDRDPCLLSGSLGAAYPLRTRIHEANLPGVTFVRHPGYSNVKTHTPDYLTLLSRYKVAICTASKFAYLLRKIIEATACGCRVVTDLPAEEVVPEIDGNLVRVRPDIVMNELEYLIRRLCNEYDPAMQAYMAGKAMMRFDYRVEGARLTAEINRVRRNW